MSSRSIQLQLDFSKDPESAELTTEQQDRLAKQVLSAALERFPLKQIPTLEWRKYRTTAGTAQCETYRIGLNRQMLNSSERLTSTLLHEYAHLLAYDRAGRLGKGHGEPWKQAMVDLGLPPDVHHRFECARNQPRQKVVYRCRKCGFEFARARRLPRKGRYLHIGCGGPIQYLRIEPTSAGRS